MKNKKNIKKYFLLIGKINNRQVLELELYIHMIYEVYSFKRPYRDITYTLESCNSKTGLQKNVM